MFSEMVEKMAKAIAEHPDQVKATKCDGTVLTFLKESNIMR